MVTDVLGVMLLVWLSNFVENHSNDRVKSLFVKMAYASMFAYLFHRDFYQVAKRLLHQPDGSIPYYIIAITIIMIFVISYYGQKFYDLTISKLTFKEKQ